MARRISRLAASVFVAAMLIGVSSLPAPFSTFVAFANTTVLVMGGTGNSLASPPQPIQFVQDFMSAVVSNFVGPSSMAVHASGIPAGPYNVVAVITPEEDGSGQESMSLLESISAGVANLDGCIRSTVCDYNEDVGSSSPEPSDAFVVVGFSQSAGIAMLEKRTLAAIFAEGEGPNVSFVVLGNSRPNGGLIARDTAGIVIALFLGRQRDELVTDPAPTDTQYRTVDVAVQYDGLVDAPLNPLNLFAAANAYAGMVYLHQESMEHSLADSEVVDQGQHGDTTYYLVSTPVLPLLMPLQKIPLVGSILADVLDAPLRVLVEAGYDRSISPGVSTPFNLLYFPDPIKTATNFLIAIPTGLDNGIEDIVGVRPFGTHRPGPYGVGGPDVEYVSLDTSAASGAGADPGSPGAASAQSTTARLTRAAAGQAKSRRLSAAARTTAAPIAVSPGAARADKAAGATSNSSGSPRGAVGATGRPRD